MIILGQVCILTGVHEYSEKYTTSESPLGIINIVLFFAILLVCEIIYQYFQYKIPRPFPKPEKLMTC